MYTGVYLGRERGTCDELLVEGDIDDMIDSLQRHKADDEFSRALRMDLCRNVSSSSRDCNLEVALASFAGIHCELHCLANGPPGNGGH